MSLRGGQLRLLSREDIREIHLATLDILEGLGVKFDDSNVLELLKSKGAIIKEKERIARLPGYLVEECVRKAPRGFTLYARNPKHNVRFEGRRVHFSVGGQALFILDLEKGERRESTLNDLKNALRIVDALENIHVNDLASVRPRDVPDNVAHAYALVTAIKNTEKCFLTTGVGAEEARDMINIASTFLGSEEELRKRPILLRFINSVSPLQYNKEMLEGLIEYAKSRQPILFAPEAQAGATAPVTLAGLLVQQNAEVLAGIMVAQLVNPGTPVMYGTVSTIMDLRKGALALGAVEAGMINVASAQLARYYRLPSRGSGGITEAKIPGIQAAMEKTLTTAMAAMGGINFIYDAAGMLESTLTLSLEQLVIDDEMCGMISRALRGIDVNDETIGRQIIKDVGPGGKYLASPHTLKFYRSEQYFTELCDRLPRGKWEKEGRKTVLDKAETKVKQILETHRPTPIDKAVEKKLDKLLKEIVKRETKKL